MTTKPKVAPNLLAQKAVLASVFTSRWGAQRIDRDITEEVHAKHKASKDAGRYSKLLVERKDLAPVRSVRMAARDFHFHMTLPWTDKKGQRLLPSANYMKYAAAMREFQQQFEAAADEFEKNFPDMVKRAKLRLNGMFNADDYPDPAEIRKEFSFKVEILPCPDASDFRVDVAAEHLDEMRQGVEQRMREVLENTTRDTADRITDVVGKMAERPKAYKPGTGDDRAEGTFRDSLVENVRELAAVLPSFNLTGNAKLASITKKIETELCTTEPDILRDNEAVRAKVAKAADKILTDVASFMT